MSTSAALLPWRSHALFLVCVRFEEEQLKASYTGGE
jgi:hypothetical protein